MANGFTTPYPWDKWLVPGTSHYLQWSKDYDCLTMTMRQLLYRAAAKRKVKIETESDHRGITIKSVKRLPKQKKTKRARRTVGCSAT